MIRNHSALVAYLDARVRTGFAWWAQDCVTLAARAAQAQTGVNYLRRIGRRWSTAAGAARVLHELGGLETATDAMLRRIPPPRAHRGDVGLVELDGRPCLVVIEGELLVGPGLAGLVRLPRRLLKTAWSID